MVALVAARVN